MPNGGLKWELRASGSFEDISTFVAQKVSYIKPEGLPQTYELKDLSPFNPDPAIYFMNGFSDATIQLHGSQEEVSFHWVDENTSIAASAPVVYREEDGRNGAYVSVPRPLKPLAFYPTNIPNEYKRETTAHLMQIVSMNMQALDGSSSLLIGLPFAERYPDLFFSEVVSGDENKGASSYGVVSSLTQFTDIRTGQKTERSNGYPARSIFAVYHLLESKVGTFFNKKPTVMELQPDPQGKLALTIPPHNFIYKLINGPISLYDVREPRGEPVAVLKVAKHGKGDVAAQFNPKAWPFRGTNSSR
jgi:hypothetical protein